MTLSILPPDLQMTQRMAYRCVSKESMRSEEGECICLVRLGLSCAIIWNSVVKGNPPMDTNGSVHFNPQSIQNYFLCFGESPISSRDVLYTLYMFISHSLMSDYLNISSNKQSHEREHQIWDLVGATLSSHMLYIIGGLLLLLTKPQDKAIQGCTKNTKTPYNCTSAYLELLGLQVYPLCYLF